MKAKEFIIRLCVILPMALWGVFLFLMLLGIVSHFLGANEAFYCTIYCKTGIALFGLVTAAVIYFQARACLRE